MSQNFDVICYGTVCLDVSWQAEFLPPPGGYVELQAEQKFIGGEAANTAIALSRWGVRVALVGNALGDDDDGRLLLELLARDAPNIDTRFLTVSPHAHTPYCICLATPDGNRTMFGRWFTEMQCPPLDPELARSARLFTMDPNAWDAGLSAAAVAAHVGLPILAMDYTTAPDVSRVASLNVTSQDHAGPNKPLEELAAYAAELRDRFGPTCIITCGEKGCLVANKGEAVGSWEHVPAYVAPVVLDSTGAGDVFRAGLIYGELQGWELLRSVRFASAAAALNIGALGAWSGVRSLEEIEAFQRTAALHQP